MTCPPFDYDYWKREPDRWKETGVHWHCHVWRASGEQYRNDAQRRDPGCEQAPLVVQEWLRKPARLVDHVVRTPDEGVAWLAKQWDGLKANVSGALEPADDVRLGRALYELRLGQGVVWGFWTLDASHYIGLYLVATASLTCH
ncbi:hypothetical protein [Actinomadura rupiterrae]|uniref:hypothetical protein n=1 Tax=Actinomadura rupiterrae TaxID=559627 RepID=UPI0020A5DCBF|nr:hypothetical protein [Actinomadura rupiterrae]MCP2343057.1 hypothetical protein [Actinomadura rupiterrae]